MKACLLAVSAWWSLTGVCLFAADPVFEDVVVGVHGGFGPNRPQLTKPEQQELDAVFAQALRAGRSALDKPEGSPIDAVEAAIRVLEDSPLLNAGKGAVFTRDGKAELDASIMEGKSLKAGSVASVTIIRNPISAARAVMERSPHVLLIGHGAEVFATREGLDIVDPSYFWTERRWKEFQERLKKERERSGKTSDAGRGPIPRRAEWGTVGAVARDRQGNVAAGTSTGGMVMKMHGRVGDSPIIGAGTYADNEGGAVSATGHGEYFIRFAVAHDIVARVKYQKVAINSAAEEVLRKKVLPAGGEGGVIVLSPKGQFAGIANTDGLYRGCLKADGTVRVVLGDE